MIALFDASAFAMLAMSDPGWPALRAWMQENDPKVHLSDFGWGEFVSAVSLRVRRKLMTTEQGGALLLNGSAELASWSRPDVTPGDIATATALVARFDLKLKLPDAIHLATAQRLDALLVTGDARQAVAAAAIGLPVFNPLSGEVPA